MASARLRPVTRLRFDAYAIIARAVEEGAARGVRRARKYAGDEGPSDEALVEQVEREVMNALCEVVRFDEEVPHG